MFSETVNEFVVVKGLEGYLRCYRARATCLLLGGRAPDQVGLFQQDRAIAYAGHSDKARTAVDVHFQVAIGYSSRRRLLFLLLLVASAESGDSIASGAGWCCWKQCRCDRLCNSSACCWI